ncbi:hypothetical protein PghCCS26_10420 [Paenibacillus glycanilyticus]|uniref:Uncharacterized protein n=2 Tax=Paenibacillus glycanilyticus TaxID=126569 RepID=A0ABQ6NH54_9BACL|nr:hypothetical protein PghCCS26_10420 [Paenibacillus glycanilyticus]
MDMKKIMIEFDISKPKQKELYDWLERVSKKEFNEETKRYWYEMMNLHKRGHSDRVLGVKRDDSFLVQQPVNNDRLLMVLN